jgi:hypothetical protein
MEISISEGAIFEKENPLSVFIHNFVALLCCGSEKRRVWRREGFGEEKNWAPRFRIQISIE